jgi:cell division protease FtsH
MRAEERILEAAAEEEDEEFEIPMTVDRLARRHQRLQRRNKVTIDGFIGEGRRESEVVIVPRYYGELLAWSIERHIEEGEWKVVKTLGYRAPRPVYIDVNTDYDKRENLLIDGQILVQGGDSRFVVTVDINLQGRNSMLVEGSARRKEEISSFAESIRAIFKERNFYRGKKLELSGRIRFLDLPARSWESIVLDAGIKDEIRANTIGFIANRERLAGYGVPPKRGVLLVGEPGTGKTLVCKALMAGSPGITCLVANTYALDAGGYITELYELAQDLSPCIVFIEDIDLIAQNRMEWGYSRGPALLSLLAVLDGVEEHEEIITVATTNCLEVLDKAIGQRPSRFDRVIELSRPSLEQRKQLITSLCQKIPIDEHVRSYIARKTENYTPAQLQEVIYSLVIGYIQNNPIDEPGCLRFSTQEVDSAISKISGGNRHRLGFALGDNHASECIGATIDIQKEILDTC